MCLALPGCLDSIRLNIVPLGSPHTGVTEDGLHGAHIVGVVDVDERGQFVGCRILRGCGLGVQSGLLWSSHKPIIQDNATL